MSELESLSSEEQNYFSKRGEVEAPEQQPDPPAEKVETPPPSEAEAKEAAVDDDVDAELVEEREGGDGKKTKLINHGAFVKERAQRKAMEAKYNEAQQTLARVDERLRFMFAQQEQQGQQEQPAQAPSFDEDFIAAGKHVAERTETIQQRLDRMESEKREQSQRQAVVSSYQHDAATFAKDTPDFRDAYNHLVTVRRQQLEMMGATRQQADQRIQLEEIDLVQQSFQMGKRPAEVIYQMAKTYGFSAKPAQARAADGKFADPNKLERISDAQDRNKSLSNVGASAGGSEMSAEKLLKMDDEELASYMHRNPKAFKRLAGG